MNKRQRKKQGLPPRPLQRKRRTQNHAGLKARGPTR